MFTIVFFLSFLEITACKSVSRANQITHHEASSKICIMQLDASRLRTFVCCQCESRLPRFFISHYYSREIALLHNVHLDLLSDIPRCILSL